MAIFRCNKCEHIREVEINYIGQSVKCPKCKSSAMVHDTISFASALINRNRSQSQELQELRNKSTDKAASKSDGGELSLQDIDIYDTNIFAQKNNFAPVVQWFEEKKIKAQIDPSAVDTSGFFDEVALLLGKNFSLLSQVSNQIKYVQNKGYTNVKIDLSKKNKKQSKQIKDFCKTLYDYSFVAKYHFQQKENFVRLTLQRAPKIKRFFNGIWMEWFALVEVLKFIKDTNVSAACARSVEVSFAGRIDNELDLFFLVNGTTPICIECKSGEFRHDIEKYLSLRKRLRIDKEQFIVCVFGLSDKQAYGMTSMYELTFVNESTLLEHIKTII